jgi:membrane protease YdiL (CAAX protease family)
MDDNSRHVAMNKKQPLLQLFISILILVCVGILLFTVLVVAGTKIYDVDFSLIDGFFNTSTENEISFLRYFIISQHIALFIIPGSIVMFILNRWNDEICAVLKAPQVTEVAFVVILAFCVIPVTSFTGQINSAMELPDWLSGVEKWMIDKEDHAHHIFNLILVGDTFPLLLLNIFMIAIIPAIGEELIFRGVLQRLFYGVFRSGHVAIWLAAFIFSAIHFQFYGLVPRFILGLLFGYLFFWSGSLWLPVIAHFVNNAIPVVAAYFNGGRMMNSDMEVPLLGQLIRLPFPVFIGIIIFIYLRRENLKKSKSIADQNIKNI